MMEVVYSFFVQFLECILDNSIALWKWLLFEQSPLKKTMQ